MEINDFFFDRIRICWNFFRTNTDSVKNIFDHHFIRSFSFSIPLLQSPLLPIPNFSIPILINLQYITKVDTYFTYLLDFNFYIVFISNLMSKECVENYFRII